jgi:redox-sensitive bicupin YhaK (pirin superfamily)
MENTNTSTENTNIIKCDFKWKALDVLEGNGVPIKRMIGIQKVDMIDPFLMLDITENTQLPDGFPDHPHRGFETVSYMLKGTFWHEDSKGNQGYLEEGDVQWMTAGKGIMHSEMPGSFDEPASGFQLWINLKADKKLIDPYYQEIKKKDIPVYKDKETGTEVIIVAGEFAGIEGPCKSTTPTTYFDVKLVKNSKITFQVPKGNNGFAFLFEGNKLTISNDHVLDCYYTAKFNSLQQGGDITFTSGEENCRFLFLYATPLNEPIAKYGPFVMNTQEQIRQAFDDYQNGKNGFEGAAQWVSEKGKLGKKKRK